MRLWGSDNLLDLKHEAERIERELMLVDGISKITLSGFPNREIEISLNEEMMRSYQLTFQDIGNAVRSENIDLTGGKVKGENQEFIIRSRNKSNKAIDLEKIVIKALPSGQIIYLKDVASVKEQWEDTPTKTYVDGERSVNVTVKCTRNEDILFATETLRNYIKRYNETPHPFNLKMIYDGSKTLRERIDLLTENGITGTILVFVILALFLNFRLSFWVALGIPVSFAGMFIIASYFGMTINVISLFGDDYRGWYFGR